MTERYNTVPEIDAAITRTRRIAANISNPEDLRVLTAYILELERKLERVKRESNRAG